MLRFILRSLGALFALGTLGGIIGAIGIVGIFFAYGRDLPDVDQLSTYEPATISRVYNINGVVIDEFAQERRLFTPEDEIPDIVKHAFISAEDKNFYNHAGYDPAGIAKALYDAAKGERLRGASTITQQVMKNFLLDGSRQVERKIKEIILATRIENTMSKDKILELYLNEIFLGQNSYGVTAAAETYFARPIEQITIAEAAYLAVLPKAPSTYHPVRERERAIARRNFVLKEMLENGYITEGEHDEAVATDLVTVQTGDFESVRASRQPRGYFTDEIRRQLSRSFGEDEFFTGGMAVRATMNPELQEVAEQALRQGLEDYDRRVAPWRGPLMTLSADELSNWRDVLDKLELPRDIDGWHLAVVTAVDDASATIEIEGFEPADNQTLSYREEVKVFANREYADETRSRIRSAGDFWSVGDVIHVKPELDGEGAIKRWTLRQIPKVQGGFMAMDPHTGRVIAMQGGFSYQHSVFNRATQALRQPGSSFKPFVYASALDSGYSPASIIVDAPIEINTPQGLWRPKNASNKFYGPAPLRVGIEQSRNLMTIRLAQDVGMNVVARYAERFGVYDSMDEFLALSLGAQETTLYKMVTAYAMFANGGEQVEPTLVDRVQDRFGRSILLHDQRDCVDCNTAVPEGRSPTIISNRQRIMDPITAYQLTSMMRGVVQRGTARSVAMSGVPIAGKTGTTNDARDVWFIGYTKNLVAGCYIGFDQPAPLGRGASGGGMCGPVFKAFMQEAIKTYGAGQFNVPEGGRFIKFDRYSGVRLDPDAQGEHVIAELFREGDESYLNGDFNVIDGGFSASVDIEIFTEFLNREPGVEDENGALVIDLSGSSETDPEIDDGNENAIVDENSNFGSLTSGGTY